ncbi:MAG TPA: glutathione S-transferase N-terminal domain-containing protein, partial [Sphingomicrobium sp.]|nr:glutathione S-transferase N-terminal domain-containing protein [Sphingomicrobium sp.]
MQRVQRLLTVAATFKKDQLLASMIRIIGSFVGPYVRKVLAAMNLKGLAYEVDPITPFYGNDEFERLSPLRRIPVLVDGDFH